MTVVDFRFRRLSSPAKWNSVPSQSNPPCRNNRTWSTDNDTESMDKSPLLALILDSAAFTTELRDWLPASPTDDQWSCTTETCLGSTSHRAPISDDGFVFSISAAGRLQREPPRPPLRAVFDCTKSSRIVKVAGLGCANGGIDIVSSSSSSELGFRD